MQVWAGRPRGDPVIQTVRKYYHFLEEHSTQEMDANLLDRMTELNAWDFESKAQQVLGKLGIYNLAQPVDELSGGQKKRVALAKLLLEEPDMLIIDEPTNHLDLEAIEWLEEYLSKSRVSLLLVTHDRYFLQAVTNQIIELLDAMDKAEIERSATPTPNLWGIIE